MNLINIIILLSCIYFQVPVYSSDFVWIFNFWFYLITFALQLTTIYLCLTEPGVFAVFENELRNVFDELKSTDILNAVLNVVLFCLLIYTGLSNVLIAYTLELGAFYYIKFFLLEQEDD